MIFKQDKTLWCGIVAAFGLAIAQPACAAVTVSHVYSFSSDSLKNPVGNALLSPDGRLYGVAAGGTWSVTKTGTGLTTLALPSTVLAADIRSSMVADSSGRFYGTALYGDVGYGSLFTFAPGTPLTVVASARVAGIRNPVGNPTIDAAGNVYVVDRGMASSNAGAIKRLSADQASFTNITIFESPTTSYRVNTAAVVFGTDGVLYGVNSTGGTTGLGSVYSIRTDGSSLKTLHDFTAAEGQPASYMTTYDVNNSAGLVEVGQWLYGNTYNQAANTNGSVYRVKKDGTGFQVLHHFSNTANKDGSGAAGTMVLAPDGNVYGTTNLGGANGDGTLWRIVTANADGAGGGFESLHSFKSAVDGKQPLNLSLGSDGFLYGITFNGGTAGDFGTVFKVDTGYVPAAPLPSISLLRAAPDSIVQGGATTLSWAASNATACTASGAWSGAKATSGSEVLTPGTTGNNVFTLRCSGPGGDITQSAALQVLPPPSAVITSFTATPSTVSLGGTVVLDWSANDATACNAATTIGGSTDTLWTGSKAGTASETLTPLVGGEHLFMLNCTGVGGNADASITVNVTLPARITAFAPAATSVAPGASTTLTWASADATSCIASGAWTGSKALSGTESVSPALGKNVYALRCYGEGGDVVKSFEVTAAAAAAPVDKGEHGGAISPSWMLAALLLLRRRRSPQRAA